jgi:hypothetical protein
MGLLWKEKKEKRGRATSFEQVDQTNAKECLEKQKTTTKAQRQRGRNDLAFPYFRIYDSTFNG